LCGDGSGGDRGLSGGGGGGGDSGLRWLWWWRANRRTVSRGLGIIGRWDMTTTPVEGIALHLCHSGNFEAAAAAGGGGGGGGERGGQTISIFK